MMKKLVIVGPESTGKSTITQELADHYAKQFPTAWVPEFAREYLENLDRPYTYEDLVPIAEGQLAWEDRTAAELAEKAGNRPSLLFVDTNMMVMQVWSEFVFQQCDPFILNKMVERQYDYYFLMQTDLPWAFDKLREYPDMESRERLFKHYYDILQRQSTPWSIISGRDANRLQHAIDIVDDLLSRG